MRSDAFDPLQRPLRAGARLEIPRVPIGDSVETLVLERFDVWAPDAVIVEEHADGSRTRLAPPPVQYYRGTLGGDPDTLVFLSAAAGHAGDTSVQGLIFTADSRYRLRSSSPDEVMVEEAGPEELAQEGFTCELDGVPEVSPNGVPKVRTTADATANGTLSGTGTWGLNLAIETDYELYTDLGSNAANVTTFIGNLVGAASVIYQRDLRTDLLISFSRVQTSASDPFNVDPGTTGTWNGTTVTYSTSHALAELGDIWGNAGTRPFNGARSSVVLVSGKNQTAGVAWIGTSCGSDFACSGGSCGPLFDGHVGGRYAYLGLGNQSTTAVASPNNTVNGVQYGVPSTNYWSLLGFAHELGHNVDGPHTHCFALSAADKTTYNVTRNYIDECFTASGCYGGTRSVPAERGTIMSYCHLTSGTWPTTRFLFGKSGEPSELMANRIKSYINSVTPASPSISAPASIAVNTSGNASLVSPSGSLSYQWTIANGTINGSSTGTSVNFTATANPVTLRVRGTNTSGCSASDSVSVPVSTCVAPSITSITPSVTITLGTTVQLSATATGGGPITYQWYVGAPGNTSSPAAAGNPINATPSVTTTYWVRATGSCGTVDSGAVNVGVVVPPATSTSLYIVTPCRIIDTRGAVGPRGGPSLASGATRDVQITGVCGIPAGANAVVANVTAVAPTASGFLALYPGGTAWPGNSNLSYRAGKTRANNSILALSAGGTVTVRNSGATQNFIIDVTGYLD